MKTQEIGYIWDDLQETTCCWGSETVVTFLCPPHLRKKFRYMNYEGHLESKERFAIKKYLLIIGKKKNMQVLSHTFTYFFT